MTNGQENSILTNFLHGDMNNPDAFFNYYLSLNSQIQKTQATTYLANISQSFFYKAYKKKLQKILQRNGGLTLTQLTLCTITVVLPTYHILSWWHLVCSMRQRQLRALASWGQRPF